MRKPKMMKLSLKKLSIRRKKNFRKSSTKSLYRKSFRNSVVKKYREEGTGRRIVEVGDLSFISDKNYPYNWFERHYQHKHCKHAVKKADIVIAKDEIVARDIVKYYFTPKSKIRIRH